MVVSVGLVLAALPGTQMARCGPGTSQQTGGAPSQLAFYAASAWSCWSCLSPNHFWRNFSARCPTFRRRRRAWQLEAVAAVSGVDVDAGRVRRRDGLSRLPDEPRSRIVRNPRVAWTISLVVVSFVFGLAHIDQGITGQVENMINGLLLGIIFLATRMQHVGRDHRSRRDGHGRFPVALSGEIPGHVMSVSVEPGHGYCSRANHQTAGNDQ